MKTTTKVDSLDLPTVWFRGDEGKTGEPGAVKQIR